MSNNRFVDAKVVHENQFCKKESQIIFSEILNPVIGLSPR